jgi:hypothetical protein
VKDRPRRPSALLAGAEDERCGLGRGWKFLLWRSRVDQNPEVIDVISDWLRRGVDAQVGLGPAAKPATQVVVPSNSHCFPRGAHGLIDTNAIAFLGVDPTNSHGFSSGGQRKTSPC